MKSIKVAKSESGFTMIIAITLTMVFLSIITAIVDISFRQSKLVSSGIQSSQSLYAADTGLECALFYDLNQNAFFKNAPNNFSGVSCGVDNNIPVQHTTSSACGYPGYEGCYRFEFQSRAPDGFQTRLTRVDYIYRPEVGTNPGQVIIVSNGYNATNADQAGVSNRRLVYSYGFGGNVFID